MVRWLRAFLWGFAYTIMAADVMPLSAQIGPLEVKITGHPPYEYAVMRATELSLEQSPWQNQQHPCRVVKVLCANAQGTGKECWATALLQERNQEEGFESHEMPVHVNFIDLGELPPTKLLVSNSPEKVLTPRILFEGAAQPNQPARLLFHHVNYTGALLSLSVELLNPSLLSAQVQVVDAVSGPSLQESEVGHHAAFTFLNRVARNTGYIATIPPNSAITISNTIFPQRNIISGLAQFRVLSRDQLIVRVRTRQPGQGSGVSSLVNYTPSSVYGDFEYLTTHIYYHGTYTVGTFWLFMPLGELATPAVRPGQNLGGSYGVTHKYELTARNPTRQTAAIVLQVTAAGGPGRLIYSLDDTWHETDVLRPGRNVPLMHFSLSPGQSRVIHLRAIPESGSNYPMRFILRSL